MQPEQVLSAPSKPARRRFGRITMFVLPVAVAAVCLSPAIRIYAATGRIPREVRHALAAGKSPYVPLADVSRFVLEALISSQDRRFYSNVGVDLRATARAIFFTVIEGRREGASTITEQLAKNALFRDVDSFRTDIVTKLDAPFITIHFPKRMILELYLNDVIYTPTARGIGKASQSVFGVSPKALTLVQAAYLIAVLNAPGYFADHRADALRKARMVLYTMARDKYISSGQHDAAVQALQGLQPASRVSAGKHAQPTASPL